MAVRVAARVAQGNGRTTDLRTYGDEAAILGEPGSRDPSPVSVLLVGLMITAASDASSLQGTRRPVRQPRIVPSLRRVLMAHLERKSR